MHEFEETEEIRQWLIDAVGEDLRACGIAEEVAGLEVEALANGVSLFLAQMKRSQREWPVEQARYLQRLNMFQLLSEINHSPEHGA